MRRAKRNIGREILQGIAELRRGKTGRVTQVAADAGFVGSDSQSGDVARRSKRLLRRHSRGK